MARYKTIDTSPRFLAVDLEQKGQRSRKDQRGRGRFSERAL